MANFNEQVVSAWDEWMGETGLDAGNPDDFVAWARENRRLAPSPQDLTKLLRKRVTQALRIATRVNDHGIAYRAKQSVINFESGQPVVLWFDTDRGGTPGLRGKAIRQRRDGIANDVYRAKCDVDHMNERHGESHQFEMDFAEDFAERRAAEIMEREAHDAA